MQNFKLDGRTIAIIAFIVIAAIIFLPRLLGNNSQDPTPTNAPDNNNNQPTVNPRDTTANDADGIELGNVVAAEGVDRNNCATTTATTFDANDDTIYVIAENTTVPQDTAVYVRWYLDGEVYEDAPEIVADQDYENTCIAFQLQQDDANQFRPGNYEAEFIINGNPADTVSFEVQ